MSAHPLAAVFRFADDATLKRFASKIAVSESCWTWTGRRSVGGYGAFRYRGKNRVAHRVAFVWATGCRVGDGLQLDHLCRNPSCVNPDHLEEVTARENTLRSSNPCAKNAQKTHCIHGHEFTKENTRVYRGRRVCRTCRRAVVRANWRANREKRLADQRARYHRDIEASRTAARECARAARKKETPEQRAERNAAKRARRASNLEKFRAYERARRAANLERFRAYERARRAARKANAHV